MNAFTERATYQAYEANDVSVVIDQSGIVRYRGAGVNTTQITLWIDNLLATSVEQKNNHPRSSSLDQNYPNPFNQSTNIRFEIAETKKVILQIYNNEGRLITTLIDNEMNAGLHEVSWNGKNFSGQTVASGVYYYKLTAGEFQSIRRLILMR